MLKNYFKTAIRNLSRNKVYTLLNVIGLALGIGCAIVIFKVINHENSFDKHLSKYNYIYRIVKEEINPASIDRGMGTPHPVGPALRQDFPEVKSVVRIHQQPDTQLDVKKGATLDKFLLDNEMAFVDPEYLDFFDVNLLAGDENTALTEPNTAIISASMAKKLYGVEVDDVNQIIGETFRLAAVRDFEVVGVMEDIPETTNFPFQILMEYQGQDHDEINPYYGEGTQWNSTSSSTNTYILVDDTFDPILFNERLVEMVEKYIEEGASKRRKFLVQSMAEVHFDDVYGNYVYSTPRELLAALWVIAIFLVLTACINFVNLATAQAANRSKEIGIRKAIGGYTRQLVVQFFMEITMITLIALFCSLAIAEFMFVYLENVIDTRLTLDLFDGFGTLGFMLVLLVLVSFLSGFYPSILLSKMNTVMALKNKITAKNNSGGLNLRKALVIAQFSISQFLIIGTVIISAQMDYFLTKDLGFEKEAIVKSYLPERNVEKMERFRQLMLEDASIQTVSFALSSPTGNSNASSNFNYAPLESEENYQASYKPADEYYMDLFGLELLAGRNFDKSDSGNFVVINRKTADLMGFKDRYEEALGERLSSGWGGMRLKVIGVMENFHSQDLSDDLQFVFLLRMPSVFYEIAFKTKEGADSRKAITKFEETWEKVYPEYVAEWQFFDQELAENYEQEQSIASLMSTFSLVSIIIGCLGLYGLIAFISANRTKEVGIRKVLGASVLSIIRSFTTEMFVLVTISFVIAAPISYYFLNEWLNGYKYRIELGLGFFALAFTVTLLIAALTISHRTIATAFINPATTLKDE
ncbi:MAG: ABC transporter permease [Ekhidna sp.]